MAIARLTLLVSGRGSNMAALVGAERRGELAGTVTAVISNRPDAGALAIAAGQGIATTVVDHKAFATREAFDQALAVAIDASEPDLIVLAGFMRVLTAPFVERYRGRMINIHPSLLPRYPGLHTHRRALADGASEHGCTVHHVTAEVDVGEIILQGRVPVLAGDDEARLAARVLEVEHRVLPAAVNRVLVARGGASSPFSPIRTPVQ